MKYHSINHLSDIEQIFVQYLSNIEQIFFKYLSNICQIFVKYLFNICQILNTICVQYFMLVFYCILLAVCQNKFLELAHTNCWQNFFYVNKEKSCQQFLCIFFFMYTHEYFGLFTRMYIFLYLHACTIFFI